MNQADVERELAHFEAALLEKRTHDAQAIDLRRIETQRRADGVRNLLVRADAQARATRFGDAR